MIQEYVLCQYGTMPNWSNERYTEGNMAPSVRIYSEEEDHATAMCGRSPRRYTFALVTTSQRPRGVAANSEPKPQLATCHREITRPDFRSLLTTCRDVARSPGTDPVRRHHRHHERCHVPATPPPAVVLSAVEASPAAAASSLSTDPVACSPIPLPVMLSPEGRSIPRRRWAAQRTFVPRAECCLRASAARGDASLRSA
jgi:hypothetical protein